MPAIRVTRAVIALCLAASAAAVHAQAPKTPPPPPPSSAELHEKLTQISQNPAAHAAAIQRGQKSAAVCRHCHGVGGNSVMPDVPNLASQNSAYLLEQMNKFSVGQRKSSRFMEGMIRALSPDERIDIALFLAAQPVARQTVKGGQDVTGKQLYAKLCLACHGATGSGSATIPRLAGQQIEYVEDSLKRYRKGDGERIDPRMAGYTRNLSDADIRHLAAYLATLQHP